MFLAVPSWAQGPRGCLLTEIPSLTVLYVPEMSSVELTSDCGLDGTKRISCKGDADRETLLKQLTCTIPGDDFEDKTTKSAISSSSSAPLATLPSSTIDDNSLIAASTKSWIWTSNTIDIDYGMPTRHRRETEDTLSPVATKSTSTTTRITRPKADPFLATNYDTEVTTSSLDSASVSERPTTQYSTKESSSSATQTRTSVTPATRESSSIPTTSTMSPSTSGSESVQFTAEPTPDYPSAIGQGQLFSIIENGTMFDIIELNDTSADVEKVPSAPSQPSTSPQTVTSKPSIKLTKLNEKKSTKDVTAKKPLTKKDIYKISDPKKAQVIPIKPTPQPIETLELLNETDITKEVVLVPVVNDQSLKLNRTFRKEVPSPPPDDSIEFNDVEEVAKVAVQPIFNDLPEAEPEVDTNSDEHTVEMAPIIVSEQPETVEAAATTAELNTTKDTESEAAMIQDSWAPPEDTIRPNTTQEEALKAQFLPRSLQTTESTTKPSNSSEAHANTEATEKETGGVGK
ncbi:unnamed protein product [Acanthoscelides obtectus]|uniref:Uncharacterized protein n=1 Tax=Acanthoscelides obtectus TaxID=200917 RepID=A0A9P0M459_ACAOB|nr:unnamed protein product [Acanthoscelides obtectus]CAH2008754.1 unnamed protein product [Acanthoscelides obtectus]CAK1673023.1 hypothetical protein AOBTE_LOCUS29205 [Acanthoscelides obtectus]CAK1673024.1 hypothetical protein AOBTE_LOCUS29205 [Acanthoscelides obtectus]